MNVATTCCEGSCQCHDGFTRLRYSYGQRLTAIDLLDEQSYFIAKDRFVARYLLGAGIVCGLQAQRGGGAPDTTPTLRVSRGAAIDACGREMVVVVDQCLDVAAWYARHRDELDWNEAGTYSAWIGLRYRECPSDPVHLPGDPCGCDGGGCSYTRVHESFELALHADDGAVVPAGASLGPGHLCESLGSQLFGAVALAPQLCPPCDCEPWLLVAALHVQVGTVGAGSALRALDVDEPLNADARRLDLHSLAALQRVVLDLAAGGTVCASGPELVGVTGDGDLDDNRALRTARLRLAVALADDSSGNPVPLEANTIDETRLVLQGIGANGWEAVAVQVTYDAAAPAFVLDSSAVELDRPYRIAFDAGASAPIVDAELRELRPLPWSATVTWTAADGTVTLAVKS